jgi:hypothetical protein
MFQAAVCRGQPFYLPTANHALYEKDGDERFFVPTPGKGPASGSFGCVRSDGWQMHEGLDIRCLQRDRHGEPTDPVTATAAGIVVYMSDHPALSNYGRYIVIQHQIDGVAVFSLYAHLQALRPGLRVGAAVQAGETIGLMGRTSNTRGGITKDRAHVHFELNLLYSERFSAWFNRRYPGERNDHGIWNGQNLVGMDPRLILLSERQLGARFNLATWIQHRTELCRVMVRAANFPWVQRYPMLVKKSPAAMKEGVAGYEMALDFNGLPFEAIARGPSEFRSPSRFQLLSVNEAEYTKNPCRRLVRHEGSHWQLGNNGLSLLELLTE